MENNNVGNNSGGVKFKTVLKWVAYVILAIIVIYFIIWIVMLVITGVFFALFGWGVSFTPTNNTPKRNFVSNIDL